MTTARERPGRGIRRLRTLAIVASAIVVAIVVGGLPLYVFPAQDDTNGADLIYVIGPATQYRRDLAHALRGGNDPAREPLPLLMSVSDATQGDPEFRATALTMCSDPGVMCGTPEPFTTNGETLLLKEYVASHSVGKTVVITFTPHVTRTRYIFAKCYGGDVSVVGVDEVMSPMDWIYQYAYQSTALVKAWFTPCAEL
ncbi:hypothetical protein [uncultured Microbacterium sp.]|uniref:hypothetical protein n=1 Tax=uncultured Microbacterium sp. TaxID=191216 RepID=UPI0025D51C80|nr:hypothetical protein [uncultured Microbacterium sp.]